MGNRPSRAQVIEIKRVEIVKRPQDGKDRARDDRDKAPPKKKPEVDKPKEKEKKPDPDKTKDGKDKEKDIKGKPEIQKEPEVKQEPPKRPKKKKKPRPKTPSLEKEPQFKADPTQADPKVEVEPSVEASMESATSTEDIPPKEGKLKKLIRVVGIDQMSPRNFMVMFILWSLRFFIPWIYTWWNFNIYILSDPAHMANLDSYFFTHEIIAFMGASAVSIILSIFADVFNLKYFIYLFLIAIFILCPITGLMAINYLWARGYNRQQYHQYAASSIVWMNWAMAVPFVAFPLEFSCFFTQVDNMTREAHYNWAAIFVFLECVNRLICYFVIPGKCPTLQWTLASVWIAIGVTIHTVFLLSCFFILWVRLQNKMLNRTPFVLKVVKKINRVLTAVKLPSTCLINEKPMPEGMKFDEFNERATPFMKKMKLILFGLVLVPVIFASFVIATFHRLELDEDWDQHEFLGATSMFIFGRVIGVLFVAVMIFVLRRQKKIKFLNRYGFLKADVMALGLPHVLIVLALILLAARFGSLHSLKEGDTIVGPIPDASGSVIEFYNADFRNRTVCAWAEQFRPVKVGPRKRETRKPPDPAVTQYEVSITLAPRTTPPVATNVILQHDKNALITYVITLNLSDTVATDLEALYNRFKVYRVTGTEQVKPKEEPQLIVINTFMLNTSSYNFYIFQYQSNFSAVIPVPEITTAEVLNIVHGRIDIMYKNDGVNSTQEPTPPIWTHIDAVNYTVFTLVLGLAHALTNASNETEPYNVLLNHYKIMQVAGPKDNPFPSKRELQQDAVVITGMVLGGIAESSMFVGLIYLFWLDTPIGELRVTTLALFSLALAIPQQFPRLKLLDISTGVAVFLLCLQILFTAMHFIGGTFLYDQTFNFRKRDD